MNEAMITAARALTPTVTQYRLTGRSAEAPLPAAVPGQHTTLRIGPRLKTLTILSAEDGSYEIALRNRDRGARRDVLSPRLFVGASVALAEPGGHFTAGQRVPFTHFLAAGVGINPILAVLASGRVRGWRLTYVDRGEHEFPFLGRLRELAGEQDGQVTTVDTGTGPRPDWAAELAGIPSGATIGACGPAAMIAEVRTAFTRAPAGRRLVVDEAGPATADELPDDVDVVCARSGTRFRATRGPSLLEQLNRHGVPVPSSCRQGICGTCEVEVRSGRVDHRDEVLTDQEKADSAYMLPCVSRSISAQLVLNV